MQHIKLQRWLHTACPLQGNASLLHIKSNKDPEERLEMSKGQQYDSFSFRGKGH